MSICAFDPGFSGGLTILKGNIPLVYKMPIIKTVKKVKGKIKTKKAYDLLKIREILSQHLDKDSLILIERVATMPGEGSVSSYNFGRGVGDLEGICVGLFNKYPIFVSPQTWKKHFPDLHTEAMGKIKEVIKKLRIENKTLKDKETQKENKKQIDKLNRQVKSLAKDAARFLVMDLYPSIKDVFQKKNTDGMAESLLIAIYGSDNKNGLV
jgi:hypothetical protein